MPLVEPVGDVAFLRQSLQEECADIQTGCLQRLQDELAVGDADLIMVRNDDKAAL